VATSEGHISTAFFFMPEIPLEAPAGIFGELEYARLIPETVRTGGWFEVIYCRPDMGGTVSLFYNWR
jgi:hypothetical protein